MNVTPVARKMRLRFREISPLMKASAAAIPLAQMPCAPPLHKLFF
jgi:hypothetical protein